METKELYCCVYQKRICNSDTKIFCLYCIRIFFTVTCYQFEILWNAGILIVEMMKTMYWILQWRDLIWLRITKGTSVIYLWQKKCVSLSTCNGAVLRLLFPLELLFRKSFHVSASNSLLNASVFLLGKSVFCYSKNFFPCVLDTTESNWFGLVFILIA